jgi:iron(II)-dependent oxidoreductase
MTLIPAGEFWMGRVHMFVVDSLRWFERDRQDDFPAHKVYLDAFYIDKYEVANDQYKVFLEASGRKAPWHWIGGSVPKDQERFPVYNVNWEEANAYCIWAGKRLPTEAEWEKAARGGLDRQRFSWGDEELGLAGYLVENNAEKETRANTNYPYGAVAVGSFAPNGYGLYDVTGNVWEWVADWYERNYYSTSPKHNPTGPETALYKVFRGGGWLDDDDRSLMNHYRNFTNPKLRSSAIGFRCAKSVASGTGK